MSAAFPPGDKMARMEAALLKARDQFEFYANEHRERAASLQKLADDGNRVIPVAVSRGFGTLEIKMTADDHAKRAAESLRKAVTNERFADMCRAALHESTPTRERGRG